MESNGKSVDRQGRPLQLPAGPLIWGAGAGAQHSFFQWLHQSVDITPIDVLATHPAVGLDEQIWHDHHDACHQCCGAG